MICVARNSLKTTQQLTSDVLKPKKLYIDLVYLLHSHVTN